jgi:hypothetical protein
MSDYSLVVRLDPSQAIQGVRAFRMEISKAKDDLKDLGTAGAKAGQDVDSSLNRAGGSASRFGGYLKAAFAAVSATAFFSAISSATSKFVDETTSAQRATNQLAAAIKSTGGVSGQTVAGLKAQASALQDITTYGGEAIKSGQGLLLTFSNIRGDVFTRATSAILDMSTAMGTDLNSAAMQLGKALNDPVKGMGALGRAGIQFSTDQKKVITDLIRTGDVAKAQGVILDTLERKYQGSASAARNTLGGALEALKNAWGDAFELGGGAADMLLAAINRLSASVRDPAFVAAIQNIGAFLLNSASLGIQALATLTGAFTAFKANLDFIQNAAIAVGAVLVFTFGPTLAAMFYSAATAVFGLTSAMAALNAVIYANPLGAFAVMITAAVAAVYYFRDEIQSAIGVDVVQITKDAANLVINSFVAAFEDIKFAWSALPAAVGSAAFGAGAAVISAVESMINFSVEKLNSFILTVNQMIGKIPGMGPDNFLNPLDGVSFKRGSNPFTDELSGLVDGRNASIASIMARDNFASSGRKGPPSIYEAGNAAPSFAAANSNVPYDVSSPAAVKQKKEHKSAIDQLRESMKGEIADLQAEKDAMFLSETAATKLQKAQEWLQDAKQKGIAITPSLIAEIDREADAYAKLSVEVDKLKQKKQSMTDLAQGIAGAFGDFAKSAISDFRNIGDHLKNLGMKILDLMVDILVIQPMVKSLSQSLMGGMTGGGDIGGILGSLFGGGGGGISGVLSGILGGGGGGLFANGGLVAANANVRSFSTGGAVWGAGTATSDSIPARLSNGEYVVNAAATRQNRALLESINSGAFSRGPRLASGGGVGSRASSSGTSPEVNINVHISNPAGNSEVETMVRQGVKDGLREYDKTGTVRHVRDGRQAQRRGAA